MSQLNNTKPKIHRNQFTPAEDALLIIAVNKCGTNWINVSQLMDNRTPRQCRDRWNHYLSPMNIHSEWSSEEDKALIYFYNQIGPKWGKLSSLFPGRTCVSTRNRCCKLLRLSKPPSESQFITEMPKPVSSQNEIKSEPQRPMQEEAGQKPKFVIPSITTLLRNLENRVFAY